MTNSEKKIYDMIISLAKIHNVDADDLIISVDTFAKTLMIQTLEPNGYDGLETNTIYESKPLKEKNST
jgi:hypothetical protein